MNRILFALTVLAALGTLALAQENTAFPPIVRQGSVNSASSGSGAGRRAATNPDNVPFCPPSSCLYYAGDWGASGESDASALFNADDIAANLEGQTWQFGRTICRSSGNATFTEYGETDGVITYSFTIQNLSKACKLKKGRVYYVNMLPTSQNGYMLIGNLPPIPQNHYGWKNYLNHCYFSGTPPFRDNFSYVPCNSEGSEFSEFQLALTGRRVH